MKNYYEVLELTSSASQEQIKSQYRLMMQAWHPDRFSKEDWKKIAEDKCKDINTAYSVLSNPQKRMDYDRLHGSNATEHNPYHDSEPEVSQKNANYASKKASHSESNSKSSDDNEFHYCESCGYITDQLRDVIFYENNGMLVMRKSRTITGNFCRNCIDYYFWLLTGRTMLFGWWGVISFGVNILILINNIFRYITSLGLKRPILETTPKPPLFWKLTTIVGYLLIGFFTFTLTISLNTKATPTHPITSNTQIVLPSPTPHIYAKIPPPSHLRATSTPKAELLYLHGAKCVYWNTINSSHLEKYACVYGNIYTYGPYSNKWSTVQFASYENSFRIMDFNYFYTTPLDINDCIVAYGKVRDYGPYLFVSPDINYEDSILIADSALCKQR